MSLKEKISVDANIFLNLEEFAEEIIYINGENVSKTIKAIVVRYELSPNEENVYRSLKKQAEVYIDSEAQKGIDEVNKKDDRVIIKDTEGIERESRINEVISRDDGLWRLLVGW